MAQENFFDQFDSQVQPVPVQSLQPIIGANPIAAQAEARQAETAEVNQAQKTFRTMTAEEAAANGLPTGGVYQINGLGEIRVVQAAKQAPVPLEAAKQGAELLLQSAGVTGGRDPVADLIKQSTSGRVEAFGADVVGGLTGEATPGMEAISRLKTITSDMVLSLTGGSLGAGVSNADVAFLKERVGNLGDPTIPANERLAAWEEVKARLQRFAGQDAAQAPANRAAAAGEAFLTERDKELQDKLSQAYASGATLAELQALAQQYGQTIPIASQEELDAARAQGRGIVVTPTGREDGEYSAKVASAADQVEQRLGDAGIFDLAAQGVTLGLSDEAGGVGRAIGQLLTGDFDVADNYSFGVDVERELLRRARERTGGFGTAAELLGGGGAGRVVGNVATTAGRAALEGAGAGGVAGFGYGEGTEQSLAGAGLGAGLGGVLGGSLQGLANRGAAGQPAASRVERDAADVVAAGEREGVRVMTSDVRRPRTWFGNWLQGTGEKLPIVGTGGIRAGQQESRVAMIEKLADEYAATPATIDDITADFMKTRGGEIAKFTKQKREVFSSLAGAPPPAPTASLARLDKAIGEVGAQETFAPLTARIRTWRTDLANARSINDVERLRKSIGDTFDDDSMRSFSTELRNIVNGPDGLYAAIKTDMGKYIRDNAGEQGFAKWSAANSKLADFAGDLEKGTIDRVLKRGEATPEEAASLLFSKRPSDVRALFKNLSPEGQKRARALVVQKLVDDAGGLAELSTAKFRNAMARSADTFGVIFPKAEADRLAGMLRLLQATRRAEQASVTTPTGQSTLPFVGASGLGFLAGDWFGAAGVGGLTATGFRLYESKAMRNLLVSLSKTEKGSKAEANVLANINRVIARSAPAAAATTQTQPEPMTTSTIEVR